MSWRIAGAGGIAGGEGGSFASADFRSVRRCVGELVDLLWLWSDVALFWCWGVGKLFVRAKEDGGVPWEVAKFLSAEAGWKSSSWGNGTGVAFRYVAYGLSSRLHFSQAQVKK